MIVRYTNQSVSIQQTVLLIQLNQISCKIFSRLPFEISTGDIADISHAVHTVVSFNFFQAFPRSHLEFLGTIPRISNRNCSVILGAASGITLIDASEVLILLHDVFFEKSPEVTSCKKFLENYRKEFK